MERAFPNLAETGRLLAESLRKPDAWGTYAVKADTITIHGTGGTIPNDCKSDGTYHFDRATAVERQTMNQA